MLNLRNYKTRVCLVIMGVITLLVPSTLSFAQTSSNVSTSITVSAGSLVITTPSTCTMTSVNVSAATQNTSCTLTGITFQDLRGSGNGWSATATMTNFVGATDNTKLITLCPTTACGTAGSTSRFSITPSSLAVFAGDPGVLTGNTDTTTNQVTTGLTNLTSSGVPNTPYSITSFSSGNGEGKYQKNVTLNLTVPAYSRAQTYNATFTISMS